MAEKVGMEKVERMPGKLYYISKEGYVMSVKRGEKGTKAKVTKVPIKREEGYLYYLGKNGYIERTKMSRGKKAKMRG